MKIIGITSTAILSLLLASAAPVYAQHEQASEKQDHPQQQQSKHEQAKPAPQHPRQQQSQHAQQQQRQDQNKQQPRAQQQKQSNQRQQTQHAQQQQRQDQNKQQPRAQQQRQSNQKQQTQHAQQQQRQDQNNRQVRAQSQRGSEQPNRTQEQQRVQQSAWQEHRSRHWDSDHRSWQQRGGYHGYRIPDERFRGYFGENHGFRIYGLPFLVVGGFPRFQYNGYWFSMVDPWPEYWANDWYDTDDVYVTYVDNGYYLFDRRYPNVGMAINISM
jgi:hypothetical protein